MARQSRSVERLPRPARPRPTAQGPVASAAMHHRRHRRPSKKTSSTGSSEKEDHDADDEKEERTFNPTGYEGHLVDTLEKDILQRNPDVTWARIAGLEDAKSVLQEAVVLPILMPDFFKVCRASRSFCSLFFRLILIVNLLLLCRASGGRGKACSWSAPPARARRC